MSQKNRSSERTNNIFGNREIHFTVLCVSVALLVAAILLFYANIQRKNSLLLGRTVMENHLELGRHNFQDTLNSVLEDALFLTQTPGFKVLLEDPTSARCKQNIAKVFVALTKSRKYYQQIRYINVDGKELIRVNYHQNQATVIPEAELQNKKQRYYVAAGMNLQKDQIYISPLDLNVEHGVVQHPLLPMLRIVAPLFDQKNQHRGLIIINYRAGHLLQKFSKAFHHDGPDKTSHFPGRPVILNREGFFLLASNPQDLWGGQLGTGISFANRYPQIWAKTLTQEKGQIVSGNDQFDFLTLHLNSKTLPCIKDSSKQCTCSTITLLAHQPNAPYLGRRAIFRYFPWQLFLIIMGGFLPILWLLVSYQQRNKEHQREVLIQEKRFRLLYEHAPMPYQSLDNEGRFLEVNSNWLDTLGYQRDEVLGHLFSDFLLPEGKALFKENFPRFKNEGKTQGIEFQLIKKDASTILASFNGRVSHDDNKQFIQTHCIFQDITEQRLVEERIAHLALLRKTGIAVHRHLASTQENRELLQAICDVFVNEKGYRSAWIILLDKQKQCELTANAGLLKDFQQLEKEIEQGHLPPCILETMQERQLLWQDSQQMLCSGCPMANGYPDSGLMAAPLFHGEQFYGVVTVSLAAQMVIDSEERELFEEIARDIGFALFNRLQDEKREEHAQELATRDQISRTFILHQDNNLYGGVLDIVLAAMKSKDGVFGYLDGPDMLVCPSMSHEVLDKCQMSDKQFYFPREQWAGIWEKALVNGSTEYANTPFKVPQGHLAIDNSMATAIIYDNRVIGLLQVANKEHDYTEKDKYLLESLAVTIAPILQARLEHQQAETKLQDALNMYADLYNNAPDMFVSVDAGNAHILQCNQTLLDTLGYTRDELIGKPVFMLYHPDSRDECKNDIFPTFCKTGIISDRELLLQRKAGSSLPVSLDVSAIRDSENNIIQSRSILHDISERKQLHEQLLISEKMTTIAGLAAGVAHEINTPLSGVLQAIQLIEMGLDPNGEENRALASRTGVDLAKVQDYLQQKELDYFLNGIKKSASTAAHIVKELLQFSRPQESSSQWVNLAELLDRSIELARADYSLKKEFNIINVEFVRQYSKEPLQVNCLAMEIEQVLINLIKNACQAMADVDSLETPRITLRTHKSDNMVVIEVEDNGPGIDKTICAQIFDPFFTTKDVGQGTGLGLSVSYSIITDKHGGSIRLGSTSETGTCFVIELPMEQLQEVSSG